MKPRALVLCAAVAMQAAPNVQADPIPADAAALVRDMVQRVDAVQDYTLKMTRRQRADGKETGELPAAEHMLLKHRRSPACLYIAWDKGLHEGREAIYCDGRYDGKVQMHEGGVLGLVTLSIDPKSQLASRNPDLKSVGDAGLFRLPKVVAGLAEGRSEVPTQLSTRDIGGVPSTCILMKGGAEVPRPFKVGDRELCISTSSKLPDAMRLWSPSGTLMEDASFSDIKLQAPLADADFDTANKAYRF